MRAGVVYSAAAYLLWSLFPLYFTLLARSGPLEIIGYRVVCSLVFCVLILAVVGGWRDVRGLLAQRRTALMLVAAGVLVTVNWTVYVVGVNSGRTLDAALGYFINPLVAAVLGVVVLRETMSRVQWVAFVVGVVACVVLALGYGKVPWIAFGVASTFGVYSLVKKQVGAKVTALSGLTVETATVAPVMVAYLVWLTLSGGSTVEVASPYGLLMMAAGPITAIPLLLFAAGARRVRLVTLGMIQYIAPIGQFLLGWLVFHEPMPPERWVGFALVWVAVALFAGSALWQLARTSSKVPAPTVGEK
ncbi:EamA family transporter RarD [Tessaracoccus antarcticus]|uniref:EamA family transporter RarD n=1 Tax=Tessaracoccus antarcticus TaxID=2479848 RepID=A0A3M0G3T6_9ACTN|nr:EamA family transporter RarD [Tessaracoccus antarcticus]RMB59630.1 EamA family transporter RarD [Tessaracoccus antarcticus]